MATFFLLKGGCNKVAKTPLRNSVAICSRFRYVYHRLTGLCLILYIFNLSISILTN